MSFPDATDQKVAAILENCGIETRFHESPNFNERTAGRPVDVLVIHYTALGLSETLACLARPASQVSTHYVIGRNGALYQQVSVLSRAWHAGVSLLYGEGDVNGRSIGIDLVFIPGRDKEYTEAQLRVLAGLGRALLTCFPIRSDGVVGHEHVAVPPGRKKDPGRWLDWVRVYRDLGLGRPPKFLTGPS